MSDVAADVVAYGLAAGLSVSAFLATVVVLTSARGRTNAVALLAGFVTVLAPAVAVAALLTDVMVAAGGQQLISVLVKLGLGLVLLAAAWRIQPWLLDGPDVGAKLEAMEAKLQGLEPVLAWRVGAGLAFLPKRIVITLLAGAAIGASGVSVAQGIVLTALYLLTATGLIWISLTLYVLGGKRAADALEVAQDWVVTNARVLAFAVLALFGTLFTAQAIVELVT